LTTTQTAVPGAAPQQAPSRVFRSQDGKMRVDAGTMSVITDPAKDHTVVLDHVKKIAHIAPKEVPPPVPGMPGLPQMPPMEAPKPQQMSMQDLGKGMIEGHEVEGKRYIIQPPEKPKLPEMPAVPKPPALAKPGMPAPPEAPQAPPPPPMPTVAEIWTSTSLKTPVLTKVKGDFGEQITHCKPTGQEPPPAAFEIPQDYKKVLPPMPKPPAPPPMPAAPKPPSLG
jgi:hypothetical protein